MRVVGSIAIALALCAGSLTQPVAAQQYGSPPGSWQGSCRNGRTYGGTFSADCQANGGAYRHSSINLSQCRGGSVGNNNGQLFCESGNYRYGNGTWSGGAMPQGTWQSSCRNAYMRGSILTASCTDGSGRYVRSSLNVSQCRRNSVANHDGRLSCGR
jgi:hypothetical protein